MIPPDIQEEKVEPMNSPILKSNEISNAGMHNWKKYLFADQKYQRLINSNWKVSLLDKDFWEEDRAPVVKVLSLDQITFDELEFWGIATDRLIAACSSFLTQSPENHSYVLGKCVMRNMSLSNITLLYYHRYLEYIDLAYNSISNLEALSGIPYLIHLNVSYNELTEILMFKPGFYLTYVNLSFNHITEMRDLDEFWSIVHLDLSHNQIEKIRGLKNLNHLRYLNLSYNLIEHIEHLDHMNVEELNLEGNCLKSFKLNTSDSGLSTMANLRTIILGYNRLTRLDFFKNAYSIRQVDLKFNKIADLLEVSNLPTSIYEINFTGNECTQWPKYREVILLCIPNIISINGEEVSVAEKVSAKNSFSSSLNLIAARSTIKLNILEQLNIPKMISRVSCYDELDPPLIILCGPCASKKLRLALHLTKLIPEKMKYCKCYTTRNLNYNENEQDGFVTVNREEFNEIARRGEFLTVQEFLGDSYGFRTNEITDLIRENKMGIVQMDLQSTIQIRNRYSNVHSILIFLKEENNHRELIKGKFNVYVWIKDSVNDLLAVKIGDNIDSTESKRECKKIQKIKLPMKKFHGEQSDLKKEPKNIIGKRIKFQMEDNVHETPRRRSSSKDEKFENNELRVILDEWANVIEQDSESKRQSYVQKLLNRKNQLEIGESLPNDSWSSEDLLFEEIIDNYIQDNPETLKDVYTETVIKSRNMYFNYHQQEPGFFSLVVRTDFHSMLIFNFLAQVSSDDYTRALKSLLDFIQVTCVDQKYKNPPHLQEIRELKDMKISHIIDDIIGGR